jgi:hypothetical protein
LVNWGGKNIPKIRAAGCYHDWQANQSIRALGTPIGSALLIGGIRSEVPRVTTAVTPDEVINAGATGLDTLTTSPTVIALLRTAYSIAVSRVMIFLVIIICISVPTSLGMRWLNIKKISVEREEEKRAKLTSKSSVAVVDHNTEQRTNSIPVAVQEDLE